MIYASTLSSLNNMHKRQGDGRELENMVVSAGERRNQTFPLLKAVLTGGSTFHDGTYLHVGIVIPLHHEVSHGLFCGRDSIVEKLQAVTQALPQVWLLWSTVSDELFDETARAGYVVLKEGDGNDVEPLQGSAVAAGGCLQGACAEIIVDVWIVPC